MFIAPIHWFCNFFFVHSPTYGIGFTGAPIVTVISNWLMFIGILIYIRFSRAIETWGGWDISAFYNMSEYFKLALPAVVTVCAEWVGFKLLVIGVSYFGASQLAANAIMLNTNTLVYQFSNGLGFGTSPRIGNLIGAAKPRQARIAAKMALLAAGFIGVLGILFLVFCGDWWALVYTSDPDVISETAKLIPALCTLIVSDGINAILSAILRGLGRQKVGANIFLFAFYVCAVPIGLYLGYVLNMQEVASHNNN
ncbi:ethionine resistance protein [Coemansia asiatica]|uniref:Ethionine resistance protein n=1 Tax=Coemansia asiatica TaxID=1052880 RepID=A0A9W7XGB2_9FUNG|nr:ethionine resistance protein [Coemansia asiatica]